jgi:hypothetical protein
MAMGGAIQMKVKFEQGWNFVVQNDSRLSVDAKKLKR